MIDTAVQLKFYKTMLTIRKFEERVIQLYAEGFIPGHVHLYVGEEPIAAGISLHLRNEDYAYTTHRPHGHMIAKGARMDKMMAEILGKAWGYNHGKGGHMHLAAPDVHVMADAIVGGGFTVSAGTAMAQKLQGKGDVTVCYFGDGAANQGGLYEVLNIAAKHQLPLILVCENNKYAISTSREISTAGPGVAARAKAFGVASEEVDGYEPLASYQAGQRAVERARKGEGPTLLEVDTYRLRGHREGDPQSYRSREEVKEWRAKDPLKRFANYLLENKVMTADEQKVMLDEINAEIEKAVEYAKESPYPELKTALEDIYAPLQGGGE